MGCSSTAWLLDPGFGERLAKKENKPILFYFKAWDSTQHRNMGLKVFGNADVKKEMRDTVNIELEFAWSEHHTKRYGVSHPQVCVMCKPDGTKVSKAFYANPVPSAATFLEWLRQAKSEATPAPATSGPS